MKKHLAFFLFLFSITNLVQAQQNPTLQSILGHNIGTKFTRHHQVVDYFKALQKLDSSKMKLEKYGETYEGRELMLAFISNEQNIKNLEAIKKQNIALTQSTSQPINLSTSIVWLSYNVHGDEPASTEAAMLTAYELLFSNKPEIKNWLQNTIVIIDPCLNPDGRDKYVNWYNNTVGANSNNDAQSREHFETYPQGRTNHYNFDLNRDWAWQTQIETQQRIEKYLEWMPHVHVDFHEQGYNDPYYFAPAAEPMHNVITPWQKNFQTKIGKNHSKYFDENGWLYFTKQIFDLFYPSYGDTYPTFNGSIGMTYEQGGKSAGLAVKTSSNEVLSLFDRVQHHVTTSLSTIETASNNAKEIVAEFSNYFKKTRTENVGEYNTYLLTCNDFNKLKSITNLLDNNKIVYGSGIKNSNVLAYHFGTNKKEKIIQKSYTIAISTNQPHGNMVSVLFEPKSNLSDTNTYDITAWSLPYVYGIDAYALNTKETLDNFSLVGNPTKYIKNTFGCIVPYKSFASSQFAAYLLKNSVKIRIASKPFTIDSNKYDAGTIIVLKNGNTAIDWNKIVMEAAIKYNLHPVAVKSGFVEKGSDFGSADVKLLLPKNIALITGNDVNAHAIGEVWSLFDNELQYPITLIQADRLQYFNLKKYDVIIMADGGYSILNEKNVVNKLKDFVKTGGRIVALQEAINALANTKEFGIKAKEDETPKDSGYAALRKYENRERDYLINNIPGAIYKVEMDNSHPLAYGYDSIYYTLKLDANIYEFMKDGWNVGHIKQSNYVAGFRGFNVSNKLKDGTLFGSIEMGNGSIVILADNPLFRLFWENGKQLFFNAVFMPN